MSALLVRQTIRSGPSNKNNFLVLLILADLADEQGFAHPSMKQLGAATRLSEDTTRRCLRNLISLGCISKQPHGYRVVKEH